MKHLKLFESFEDYGFELSSMKEREITMYNFKKLEFTDEELESISSVIGGRWIRKKSFRLDQANVCAFNNGVGEIYLNKYEDDWYYFLYYRSFNSNAVVYKCSEFDGLINCLNIFIKKND